MKALNEPKTETVFVTVVNKKTTERQLHEFHGYPANNPYTRVKRGWKVEKIDRKFSLQDVIKNHQHNSKLKIQGYEPI